MTTFNLIILIYCILFRMLHYAIHFRNHMTSTYCFLIQWWYHNQFFSATVHQRWLIFSTKVPIDVLYRGNCSRNYMTSTSCLPKKTNLNCLSIVRESGRFHQWAVAHRFLVPYHCQVRPPLSLGYIQLLLISAMKKFKMSRESQNTFS